MRCIRQMCANAGLFARTQRGHMDFAARRIPAANTERLFAAAMDTNARRHISVATLLARSGVPLIGARIAELRPAYVHSTAQPAGAAKDTPTTTADGAAEGGLAASGDDDETDGTESGRVSRSEARSDSDKAEDTGITDAHVANGADVNGAYKPKTTLKFKEYGNVYDKHEPTMFGDWSHMGRVTDF